MQLSPRKFLVQMFLTSYLKPKRVPEKVKEFINLTMSECPDRMLLTQSNRQVRCETRHIAKRDWFEIGRYLDEVMEIIFVQKGSMSDI